MNFKEKIICKINGFEISTKITLAYAACFTLLLFIINVAMWIGVMTALYDPAERTIRYSMRQVEKIFDELQNNYDDYSPESFRGALVAGVVLRVVDEQGNLFIDTDPTYPSLEEFEERKLKFRAGLL